MFKKIFKFGLLSVWLVLILSGCTFPWEKTRKAVVNNTEAPVVAESEKEMAHTNEIKKFKDEAELKHFLQNNTSFGGMTMTKTSSENMSDSLNSLTAESATISNQVVGVDEADIVKTDGTYIYTLVKNELIIINSSSAADIIIAGKITFKSVPSGLFVSNGKLVVFGNDDKISENATVSSFKRQSNYVFLKIFDVSNPADPREVRSLNFEGNYTSARLIGNYVYFITDNYAYYIEGESLTPHILEAGKIISGGCVSSDNKCLLPETYYFDAPYNNYNFISVNTININDSSEQVGGQVYLIDSAQNIYVSADNIYIANIDSLSEYELEQEVKRENLFSKLDTGNQDKIKKIEESPSFVLNEEEKAVKVGSVVNSYFSSLGEEERKTLQVEIDSALLSKIKKKMKDIEKTIIYKIAIKTGKIQYQAKGEVQGRILNQFSLDEHKGYLRIATARNEMWSKLFEDSSKAYSNIYILDENLLTVGSLENIATDERMSSTRFMGDRAYVATFKKSGPLYVIDLSNTVKPTILGAVKISGSSTYLYPINEQGTKILGFGRDEEELTDGGIKIKGLKLSLFDFSNLSEPKELSSYVIGDEYDDSLALSNHRAFFYAVDKNLISVPAVLQENNKLSFSGALVFSLEGDSLKLNSKINHLPLNPVVSNSWRGYFNDNIVRRNLYLNNNLFTLSDKYLKVNSLADLSAVTSVILTPGPEDYIITPEVQPEQAPIINQEVPAAINPEPVPSPIQATSSDASTSPDVL